MSVVSVSRAAAVRIGSRTLACARDISITYHNRSAIPEADYRHNGAVEMQVATTADADRCFGVQKRSAVTGYAHIFPQQEYPFPDDVVRQEWATRLGAGRWVVMALIDGDPVGTISTHGNQIGSLFVVPEQWGSGVAAALLDAALANMAEQGTTCAELDVMAENMRARRFYERRGWHRDGREYLSPFPPYPRLVGYRCAIEPVSRSKA